MISLLRNRYFLSACERHGRQRRKNICRRVLFNCCASAAQWRTQDFLMGGFSVTSHHDDVKILRHHDVTSLAVSI